MEKLREIALIVAGIDEEYQNGIIDGIIACARERGVSLSCFAAFGGVITGKGYDIGEYNIYNLINYERFDGVLLMINTICDADQKQRLADSAKASGLPVVVFDCGEYPEFYNITIDNISAMKELVRHVITVHGAKRLGFIAGPESNPEARDRLTAFKQVCEEYGIEVPPEAIHYGEFRSIDGRRAAEAILKSGGPLPDALICSNDAMALSAMSEFSKHGIHCPDSMIVTGFDNTYNARYHFPSLTTVERPLVRAGFLACDTVLRLIDGEKCDKVQRLSARAVFAESCGCMNAESMDIPEYRRSAYNLINSCREDINLLNRLNSELAEAESESQSMSIIFGFLEDMDCERCCICLCDDWDKGNDLSECLINGYTETMHAPLIWDRGAVRYYGSFPTEQMNPIPHERPGSFSYFLPLHFRERCLGYFVATNGDFPAKSMLCHSVLMNISNSLENVRKLINLNSAIRELDRLYVTDPLCGIFNRNGFIRRADDLLTRLREKGSLVAISFVDMDGLKHVNDDYGHQEGDYSLKRLAGTLSECRREGWICARFGGDEFIVMGGASSESEGAEFEKDFKERLAEINRIQNKPYDITASIGTIVTAINEDDTLFTLINRADETMYEDKKRNPSRYIRK